MDISKYINNREKNMFKRSRKCFKKKKKNQPNFCSNSSAHVPFAKSS